MYMKKIKSFEKFNENIFKKIFTENLSDDDKVFKDILDNLDEVEVIDYRSFLYKGYPWHIDNHWNVTSMIYYYDNDGKVKTFKSKKYIADLIRAIDSKPNWEK